MQVVLNFVSFTFTLHEICCVPVHVSYKQGQNISIYCLKYFYCKVTSCNFILDNTELIGLVNLFIASFSPVNSEFILLGHQKLDVLWLFTWFHTVFPSSPLNCWLCAGEVPVGGWLVAAWTLVLLTAKILFLLASEAFLGALFCLVAVVCLSCLFPRALMALWCSWNLSADYMRGQAILSPSHPTATIHNR